MFILLFVFVKKFIMVFSCLFLLKNFFLISDEYIYAVIFSCIKFQILAYLINLYFLKIGKCYCLMA